MRLPSAPAKVIGVFIGRCRSYCLWYEVKSTPHFFIAPALRQRCIGIAWESERGWCENHGVNVPSDIALSTLAREAGARLLESKRRLATAESCTGGWIAKLCTDIAGSSDWFDLRLRLLFERLQGS